jgi:hypothetical protein
MLALTLWLKVPLFIAAWTFGLFICAAALSTFRKR